ncbi:MAG: hypothetical protein Q8O66_02490 [bacterium]|nr:hypothetical protein [bacterium]
MFKKLFCNFLLFFVFFSVLYLYLPTDSVFAELEINYPVLNTGASVTAQTSVPEYLKYVFDFSMFIGFFAVFLSFVASGVLYFLAPALPGAIGTARDRVSGAISGLLILITLYLIITTINPALSIFKTTTLSRTPEFPPPPPPPGVLFYTGTNCPTPNPDPITDSLSDLGKELNNKISSVKIVQGRNQGPYFVSILYENPKFRGKCFYVDPNIGCGDPNNNIVPFASSASVERYSPTPYGDVVFFRNTDSKSEGGYFTVRSSDINGIYFGSLDQLRFTGQSGGSCTVPKKEQDCIVWSKTLCSDCVIIDGKYCKKTQCPSLAGDNVGSMEINGRYIVLFVYYDSTKDPAKGPWSFCQAFPTPDDVNKKGPQQIKWEDIENNQLYKKPNWVTIIPIEK